MKIPFTKQSSEDIRAQNTIEQFTEKFSASIVYAILSSIAVNFFFVPGHVYSTGATGLAQILSTLSHRLLGFTIPVSVTLYAINLPLFILAWKKIGHKFTLYTILTVTLSSIFMQIIPEVVLTTDPIINAIFGGLIMGAGIGYSFRNGISSGGTDIISLAIRKKTGRNVGHISLMFNAVIVLITGVLFGWKYMFYSLFTIFVSSRVTDAIYTKQKKMQVMIVTKKSHQVSDFIQNKLHRGVTIINNAEGAYSHDEMTILLTIITRAEFSYFKNNMKKVDENAFVSISENVKILGNFDEG
ncbi:YitT family protein [Streptococcaceae bacterium ESL0729]|nr:YitT family protein [Streptococcaceae bacterium ESL0729]